MFSISEFGFAVGLNGSSTALDSQVPGIAITCTSGQLAGWADGRSGDGGVTGGLGTRPASRYHATSATSATSSTTINAISMRSRRLRPRRALRADAIGYEQ